MAEEGRAPTLERTERIAVLPRLSVAVSLVRLRVPKPPAVCFMATPESLARFTAPSRGAAISVLSLLRGRSGDLTREMDDLEMG